MGPLAGVRVLEIAGIGPGPFCAMMLADMGADVVRVDRVTPSPLEAVGPSPDVLNRGRRSVAIDLKRPEGAALLLELVERADALIEGFRPGVMERLGLGPAACLERNSRLVYGRVTGWGQEGPIAHAAGHDLNYVALSGALRAIGRRDQPPPPPLNLLADFGGGGMLLAVGVLAALHKARADGVGQVVDAAMVDGVALLSAWFAGARACGIWGDEREANLLDGGAPFYDVYRCADGEYVSIAALEPQFYAALLEALGLVDEELPDPFDRAGWPVLRRRFEQVFASRTRDEWTQLLEGTDVCFAPVLSMAEAPEHPHHRDRGTFVAAYGVTQPAPAPRFSVSAASIRRPPPRAGEQTDEVLLELDVTSERIAALRAAGVIA